MPKTATEIRELFESHLDVSWLLKDMRTATDEMLNDLMRRFGNPPKKNGRKKKREDVDSTLDSDLSSVPRHASRRVNHVLADLPVNGARVEGRPKRTASRVASVYIKSHSTLNLRKKMRRPSAGLSTLAPSSNNDEETVSENVLTAANEPMDTPEQSAVPFKTPESSICSTLETTKTSTPVTVVKPTAAKRKCQRPLVDNCSPIGEVAVGFTPETVQQLKRTGTRSSIVGVVNKRETSALTISADRTLTNLSPVVAAAPTTNTPAETKRKSSASEVSFLESTHYEEEGLDMVAVAAGGDIATNADKNETFAILNVPAENLFSEDNRRPVSTHYGEGGLPMTAGDAPEIDVKKPKRKPNLTQQDPVVEPLNDAQSMLGSETFAIPNVSNHCEDVAADGDTLVTDVKKTKRKPNLTHQDPVAEPLNDVQSETFAIPNVPTELANESGRRTVSNHCEDVAADEDTLVTDVKKTKRKPNLTHQDPVAEPLNDVQSETFAIPNVLAELLANESGRKTRTVSKAIKSDESKTDPEATIVIEGRPKRIRRKVTEAIKSDESKTAPEATIVSEGRPKRTRQKARARQIVDSDDSDSFIAPVGAPIVAKACKNKKNKKAADAEPSVEEPRSTRTRTLRKGMCEASLDVGHTVGPETFVIPEAPTGPRSTRTKTVAVASSLDLPEITEGRPERVRTRTRRFRSSESESDNQEPAKRSVKRRKSPFHVIPGKDLSVRIKQLHLSGLKTWQGPDSATRTSNRFKTPGSSSNRFKTPGSSSAISRNAFSSKKKIQIATKKLVDDETTAKKAELRQKKGNLASQSREDQLGKKAMELKMKNNEKMERVLKMKQKMESEKLEQILQAEKEKELKRQQLIEERRQQRLEEIQKKRLAEAKKMAEAEERRKLEEEARLAKVREQELEAERLIKEKQRQQELEEKRAKERQEEMKKLVEATKAMNQRMANRAMEMQKQKALNPSTPLAFRYKPKNENDLGLEDEHSEISDEETPERPQKKIPNWVEAARSPNGVMKYITLQHIMGFAPPAPKTPNIVRMFNMTPTHQVRRNSSAIWNTPDQSF